MTQSTSTIQEESGGPPPGIEPASRHHKVTVRLAVMGVTAKDVSQMWGCTPQQFLYWSRSDHRDVKSETLEKLAEMLGVGLDFLVDGDWEGLFDPMPAWFLKKRAANAKTKVLNQLEQITPSDRRIQWET